MNLNTEQLVSRAIDFAWQSFNADEKDYPDLAWQAALYANEAALSLHPSPPGQISMVALNKVADVIETVIIAKRSKQPVPSVAELLRGRMRPN